MKLFYFFDLQDFFREFENGCFFFEEHGVTPQELIIHSAYIEFFKEKFGTLNHAYGIHLTFTEETSIAYFIFRSCFLKKIFLGTLSVRFELRGDHNG